LQKLLALIAFSVLLLVPAGAQNALAADTLIQITQCPGKFTNEIININQGDKVTWELLEDAKVLLPITLDGSSFGFGPITLNKGDTTSFTFNNQGTFIVECSGGDIGITNDYEVIVGPPIEDRDGDGVANEDDNCPDDPNSDQANTDGDELGNACDENPTLFCGQGTTQQGFACVADLASVCGDGTTINNMMCVVSLAVGGYFVGIEHSSLLISATQLTAAWMLPVIVSAIGIGIVIARKF